MSPISARRVRNPGMRILYFYSVLGLAAAVASRSSPTMHKSPWAVYLKQPGAVQYPFRCGDPPCRQPSAPTVWVL